MHQFHNNIWNYTQQLRNWIWIFIFFLSVCEFMLVRKVDNLGDNATIRTSGVCLSHTQPDLQYYFKQYQFNHPLCCCYSYKCLPKEIWYLLSHGCSYYPRLHQHQALKVRSLKSWKRIKYLLQNEEYDQQHSPCNTLHYNVTNVWRGLSRGMCDARGLSRMLCYISAMNW